jgi:glycosyltransferase involved in cell wall biosynthesis
VPTIKKPFQELLDSIHASIPLLDEAGYRHFMVSEVGSPYISNARAGMLRKALDAKADIIVFLDHDLSWKPQDLLTLIQTEGDVIAGTYRFKKDETEYMGTIFPGIDGKPIVRKDGCVLAHSVPAGFLKITKHAVNRFIKAYPDLCYGDRFSPHVDLFNHGAHDHVWYGEDYAFCRNWRDAGGEVWLVPDLDLNHHTKDKEYAGNYHNFLLRQPGGSESDCPVPPRSLNDDKA